MSVTLDFAKMLQTHCRSLTVDQWLNLRNYPKHCWSAFSHGVVFTSNVLLLRSGGPALKKTQVYPALYGRRVCAFHSKYKDWRSHLHRSTKNLYRTRFLFEMGFARNPMACTWMLLWKWPSTRSKHQRSSQLGTKNRFRADPRLMSSQYAEAKRARAWVKADLRAIRRIIADESQKPWWWGKRKFDEIWMPISWGTSTTWSI